MASARDIEDLNACIHEVLLFRLHLVRLDLWSEKLENLQYLDLGVLSFAELKAEHTVGEIREFLEVPQGTLTSVIDRLEKRGLVRRAVNARDKRSYRVELTAQGVEVQREHRRVSRLISRKMLEALPTAEERSQFVELFRKMRSGLEGPLFRG
jgi:DNA-binding MarR family transcriptional regulator